MEVYPPSPNWYSPQAVDWDGEVLAYGSRNAIIVLGLSSEGGNGNDTRPPENPTEEANPAPPPEKKAKRLAPREYSKVTVMRILCGHKGRVNAVSVWGKVIASGSDDKTVRLWNADKDGTLRMHRVHKESVSAICVARERNTVLSGDKDGVVALWNVGDVGEGQSDSPAMEPIISSCFKCKVTCLKVEGSVAAVAGENGVIVLLGVSNGQRIAALEPMNGSVQSLSWCKCSAGRFLSASCGSSVRVWKLSEKKDANGSDDVDGEKEVQGIVRKISDIHPGNGQKHKGGEGGVGFTSQRCWKSAALYDCGGDGSKNKCILSIAVAADSGEISIHNLLASKKKTEKKAQPLPTEIEEGEIIGEENIATNEKEEEKEANAVEEERYFFKQNKRLPKEHTRPVFGMLVHNNWMITHSLDRMLVLWDLTNRRKVWSIGTLGGYVYTIAESPVEPQTIYFSVGDNTIRSWNRTDERGNNYDWKMRWQGLNAQVTTIDPHPLLPGLVGFGLKDGRVGIYDVGAGRFATASVTHKDAVFSLSWKSSEDGNPTLFSCCGSDGHVFYHTMDQNRLAVSKTFELDKHISSPGKHTAVAWDADGQYCALGNRDGSITVINAEYSIVCELKPHGKEVRRIVWGPRGFSALIASCSADGTIYVGTPIAGSSESGLKLLRGGHKSGAINSISFEPPPTSGAVPRLVSGGNDGRVIIWDIETESVTGELFPSHDAPVLTVLWGSSGEFIYSGGEDQTVYEHHVSKIATPRLGEEEELNAEPDATSQPQNDKKKKKKKTKTKEASSGASTRCEQLLSSLVDDFENELVTLDDHMETCKMITQKGSNEGDNGGQPKFSRLLLSNREETMKILLEEASDKGRAYLLAGDTRKYIEISAKMSLTESDQSPSVPMWVLASAAMGKDVFDASMTLHAKQTCSGGGDPYSSVLLYVVMHKIPEAVDALLQSHMFADALALAKVRLPRDDPATRRVLTTWARNLESRKMYVQASECYLAAQLPDIAVGVLRVLASSESAEEAFGGKLLSAFVSRGCGHRDMVPLTRDAGMHADRLQNFLLSIKEFLSLEETKHCAIIPIFHMAVSMLQDKEWTLADFAKNLCVSSSKQGLIIDNDIILRSENDQYLDKDVVLCVKALMYASRDESEEAKKILDELKETKSECVINFLRKVHVL